MAKQYVTKKSDHDALATRVTAVESGRATTAALTTETSARTSADNALDARLDVLEAKVPVVVSTVEPAPPAIWFEVDGSGALVSIWNVT